MHTDTSARPQPHDERSFMEIYVDGFPDIQGRKALVAFSPNYLGIDATDYKMADAVVSVMMEALARNNRHRDAAALFALSERVCNRLPMTPGPCRSAEYGADRGPWLAVGVILPSAIPHRFEMSAFVWRSPNHLVIIETIEVWSDEMEAVAH